MTVWGWVRRVGLAVVAVALVEYLAVPQLVGARSELELFADATFWLVLAALALEACSLIAYTSLTRAVLAPSVRPSFGVQLRIDLTGLGFSHLLPGGGASAAALRYRLMTTRGVPTEDALSTAAVETVIGIIGLVATFTGGVVLASPGIWSHTGYLLGGFVGLLLLIGAYIGIVGSRGNSGCGLIGVVVADGLREPQSSGSPAGPGEPQLQDGARSSGQSNCSASPIIGGLCWVGLRAIGSMTLPVSGSACGPRGWLCPPAPFW